jgi:hypothetical protein
MWRGTWLWVVVFAAFSSVCKAEKPEIVSLKDQPVLVKWKDGREAQLMIERRAPMELTTPFQVTENTCAVTNETHCGLKASVGVHLTILQWTKHPETDKVGKTVKLKAQAPGNQGFELIDLKIYGAADSGTTPLIVGKLPPQEMSCPDYSWLPGAGTAAPDSARLVRWDVEMMLMNPETGLMENRTVGVALDVLLKKTGAGTLEMSQVKKYTGNSFALAVGDIWAMILKGADGEYCQISMKPNLVGLDKKFIEYLTKPPVFEPYLWESDEHSTVAKPFFFQFLASEKNDFE